MYCVFLHRSLNYFSKKRQNDCFCFEIRKIAIMHFDDKRAALMTNRRFLHFFQYFQSFSSTQQNQSYREHHHDLHKTRDHRKREQSQKYRELQQQSDK